MAGCIIYFKNAMRKVIDFLKNSIKRKIVFFNTFTLSITLIIVSIFLYNSQKAEIIKESSAQMQLHLQDINNLLDLQIKEKQQQVDMALEVARDQLHRKGDLLVNDSSTITISAINQITKSSKTVTLDEWQIGNSVVQNNFDIVDAIQNLTGQTATIFQKIDGGYLRVSTNVRKLDGERAVGTYIANGSPVIAAIENGQTYRGRAYVVNDWYLTAYEPIQINGQTQGILYVGVKEKDLTFLKEKFYEINYFESGYPYAITQEGQLLIHPTKENEMVAETSWFKTMRQEKEGVIYTNWGGEDDEEMIHFFTHYDFFDITLAIAIPKGELVDAPLLVLRNSIFGSLIVILVVLIVLTSYFVNRQLAPLDIINDQLQKIANRRSIERLDLKRNDEIGKINESLNKVIEGSQGIAEFSKAIGEGNFDEEFKALNEEDTLGQALLEMRDSLKKASKENEERNWISHGHNILNTIIRENQDSVHKLSIALLPELVRYIDACQAAIYIYKEEGNDKILELEGAYAWGKQRFNADKIVINPEIAHGLVDQVFLEQKTILLSDVPDGFVNITSGLGTANPNQIIILPLIHNEEVCGVLEIASFNKITPVIQEFLEEAAGNMAATIDALQTSSTTRQLLEETQKKTSDLTSMEEEVRQNLEEMQATNEEMTRKEKEYLARIAELEANQKVSD